MAGGETNPQARTGQTKRRRGSQFIGVREHYPQPFSISKRGGPHLVAPPRPPGLRGAFGNLGCAVRHESRPPLEGLLEAPRALAADLQGLIGEGAKCHCWIRSSPIE